MGWLFSGLFGSFFLSCLILMCSCSDGGDSGPLQAPNNLAADDSTAVAWLRYDEGLELAKSTDKYLLVYFTVDWCGYCKVMERETFQSPDAISLINEGFVAVKVNGDSQMELDINGRIITEKDLTRLEYHVSGYPTFWLLKSNADRIGDIRGYKPKEQFLDMLSYIKDGAYETITFEEYMNNGGRKGPQK